MRCRRRNSQHSSSSWRSRSALLALLAAPSPRLSSSPSTSSSSELQERDGSVVRLRDVVLELERDVLWVSVSSVSNRAVGEPELQCGHAGTKNGPAVRRRDAAADDGAMDGTGELRGQPHLRRGLLVHLVRGQVGPGDRHGLVTASVMALVTKERRGAVAPRVMATATRPSLPPLPLHDVTERRGPTWARAATRVAHAARNAGKDGRWLSECPDADQPPARGAQGET